MTSTPAVELRASPFSRYSMTPVPPPASLASFVGNIQRMWGVRGESLLGRWCRLESLPWTRAYCFGNRVVFLFLSLLAIHVRVVWESRCASVYCPCSRLLGNLEDSVALPHISVAKEVRDKLGLPLWLAAKYAAVVFLLHLRFHVRGAFGFGVPAFSSHTYEQHHVYHPTISVLCSRPYRRSRPLSFTAASSFCCTTPTKPV